MKMLLEIPDRVAEAFPTGKAERAVLLELACGMYATRKLTHAQAADLAALERLDFERELALREIPIHYTPNDWKDDLGAGLCGE